MPARSSPSPSRISAMSAPTSRTSRASTPPARGVVLRGDITEPANWRAAKPLDDWLKGHNLPGICGVDTRAITRRVRDGGAPSGVVVHAPDGKFDIPDAAPRPRATGPASTAWTSPIEVTTKQTYGWDETHLGAGQGLRQARQAQVPRRRRRLRRQAQHPALPRQHRLQGHGRAGDARRPRTSCATSPTACSCRTARAIRRRRRATPCRRSRACSTRSVPLFGICLGHQLLALTLGGKTQEDGARPSRRQPAGQGPDHRQGRDHLAEPRLLRPARNRCPRTSR